MNYTENALKLFNEKFKNIKPILSLNCQLESRKINFFKFSDKRIFEKNCFVFFTNTEIIFTSVKDNATLILIDRFDYEYVYKFNYQNQIYQDKSLYFEVSKVYQDRLIQFVTSKRNYILNNFKQFDFDTLLKIFYKTTEIDIYKENEYTEHITDKNLIKTKIADIIAGNGYILLTKDTLVLCRTGAESYSFGGGVKIKKIPLDTISAIDVRKATVTTDLEVTIPGSQEITNSVETFTNRMLNENLFMFPIQSFSMVSKFADLVMEYRLKLIDSRNNKEVSRNRKNESIPNQIKQLSELRDLGILSEEEFQIKKNDLLSRM